MILSQPELRQAVAAGEIKFDPPLEDTQWGEASIDLRLGTQFTQLQPVPGLRLSVAGGLGQVSGFWKTMNLPLRNEFGQRVPFCLEPGEFILAMTYESVTVPKNLIALVEGRSTYARIGLSMHQTAPWIQPGWSGRIVLEIKNHGPIRVDLTPILDRPCQLSFFQLTSALPKALAYGAKGGDSYTDQKHPLEHKKKRPKK
ncbi:MAG: dCTP deaminase [Steroidobacteraceae bacterium]